MSGILNIMQCVNYDNSITKKEYHSYSPYTNNFNNSDEIRISIQHQDLYVLPSESLIYIEGKLLKTEDQKPSADLRLSNNAMAFLFEELRYELNGIEIDRSKNLGVTSTIKNKISLNERESVMLRNAGWSMEEIKLNDEGSFNYCIPLKYLLGFAEDYKKIVVNAKHELVLIRTRTDLNSTYSKDDCYISISKIQWIMPHVTPSDAEKIKLSKIAQSSRIIEMAYRSWDLYEYPGVPQSTQHTWTVKTVNQLEKPRFVIFALQTDKRDAKDKDASKFDHCSLTDFRLHLNSEVYPYNTLNIKYNSNQYAIVYDMYCKFQQSYYKRQRSEPLLTLEQFKEVGSMVVVDCSHQNENIKTGPVDVRLEFQTSAYIPEKTVAYCLLIHDRIVRYNPLTSEVQK